ncbi:VanZ family protein [Patescibacteria group bacterium]|nr:VanZ family protein [Patescibacteria group bacterium]
MKSCKRWIPALIVMCVIFLFSSMPGDTVDAVGLGKESYHINGHFLLFFLLMFSFYKAVKNTGISMLYTFAYAVFDEIHQIFVPGRSVQIFDIIVDLSGGLFAGLILWKLQHKIPRRLINWLQK